MTTSIKKVLVKDLSPYLTCTLCGGYFIDATALVDCLHVFCRGCILRYFENCKQVCPTCNTVYKKKNATFFKPDTQLQTLVYKLVPGLYSKEMQRREDFYRTTGDRAGSSCSDDSVLGDLAQDHEEWISSYVGDNNQFYSPEDSISLSLEYYQASLDTTTTTTTDVCSTKVNEQIKVVTNDKKCEVVVSDSDAKKDAISGVVATSGDDDDDNNKEQLLNNNDRRYLQCPAAVTMSHLQKFVRMKYALTSEHRVDIIYAGEVLPQHFSLMDVAYTFKWSRTKPMRFFYRIFVFTPVKVVRPIKIITTSSSNGKQLQIVPVKPEINVTKPEVTSLPQENNNRTQESEEKEKLLANLQLLSKNRLEEQQKKKKKEEESCIYEYEEPDKEEIKRFAEKRDREWAMQKHLDEQQEETRHVSKKRKKNKHSKNESVHKKRKLHAEITSNEVLTKEESLKLKVKLTPHNGHKHKHHKTQVIAVEPPKPPPPEQVSSKEKLLQMRAVRHKHVTNDDKPNKIEENQQTKTLRGDFAIKTTVATAQVQNDKAAFLKTFQSHAEKPPVLNALERKIANLKQQCTIEAKNEKVNTDTQNTKLLIIGEKKPQYNTGFTVSKIEAGVKRKVENEEAQRDKRPSLEITLINPPKSEETKAKRPPPATIPLERIKKSMNFKSGISIIPKLPERRDNIGALDLSKPSNSNDTKQLNGITVTTTKINNCTKNAVHMSNLQMLSKVALEHPTLINKQQQTNTNKPKQPLPNLQTIKLPQQKSLPKLNEISKSQFRLINPQVRNMRPNQSQNVRNIPNPSLLVRQQNQNRLNSTINQNGNNNNNNNSEAAIKEQKPATTPPVEKIAVATTPPVTTTEKTETTTTTTTEATNNK